MAQFEHEAPVKQERFLAFKRFIGWRPTPDGMPPFIWAERWNSFLIMLFVAVGVPLLGLSKFSTESKLWVAVLWFALSHPFFVYFERREIVGQMQGRGSLDATQAAEQQDSAQNPYWGVIIALVVWALVLAVHVTLKVYPQYTSLERFLFVDLWRELYAGVRTSPISYGLIEWGILLHTWIVTKYTNLMTYNEINQFNQATPRAQRTDRQVP